MAGPGVSAEQIRAGQEAMTRNPAAPVGSIEAGVAGDLRDGMTQAGLEKAAMIVPSFGGIRSLKDGNIGHRDILGTIQRNANEATLNTTANTRIDLLDSFINNGYVNMGANRAVIFNEVRNAIIGSTEMASRFNNLTPAQARIEAGRMAQEYLNDPNFRGTVIDLLLQRADLAHPIADQVSEIAIKLEDLRAERLRITQAGGEQPVAVANETGATNRLNRYLEDPSGVVANNGVFYTEAATQITARNNAKNTINTLETNTIPGHETTIQTYQNQEQQIRDINMNYEPRKHPNPTYVPATPPVPNDPNQWLTVDAFTASQGLPTLTAVRTNIVNEQGNLRTARISLATQKTNLSTAEARITQIGEEKARAEQALKEAQTKRADIDKRVAQLDKDINEQTGKYNKLQTEKELQETKWVSELDSIIRDATAARLHGELPLAAQRIKERMDEKAKNEKDEGKKAFWSFESLRYIDPDGKPIKANIATDRATLMSQTVDIQFILADGSTPTLLLNGAEQTLVNVMAGSGMNHDQIYNLLKDPTTRTDMSLTLAQHILTTHLWSGGRLSRGEIVAIHQSDWGKGMVAKAIAGRADIQAQIDASVGKDVMNWKEDLLAQLGKIDPKKFALMILIIAGIIGGVALLKK